MDVVTTFLNGDISEDIYMEVTTVFKTPERQNQVCKPQKALFGLKQSPRQLYAKIHDYLTDKLQFVSSQSDSCLYTRHQESSIIVIALYVDDILVCGNRDADVSSGSSAKGSK